MDELEKRVRDLEQRQRERDERSQKLVLGSASSPLTTVFLRDGKSGGVAKVDYDAAAGTLRITKVR